MSAARLRDAAALLRERAEVIREWNLDDGNLWITDYDPSDPSGQTAMQRLVGGAEEPWATYIATMAPPVALALADLLDDDADGLEGFGADECGTSAAADLYRLSLALANAILGDTA